MNIEDVIARSREGGGFSERKQFTVARNRAIRKLREFALADPSFYILEWIQAAVANGATYIDVALERQEVRLSYVGGGFTRAELESLFDFLFASKDNLDVADVRQLALGVNALMGLKPTTIILESGDGTLEGTTRTEIDVTNDRVIVGTPTQGLGGTFIVARWGHLATPRKEAQAIEDRCLTSPIPILVNDVPLFGYSTLRSPKLWGYPKTLEFDEGDLYGTIGVATTPITKNFKLLTFGTWISSTLYDFEGLRPMGGVIGYDRLRKTADHAKIVQDEVFHEMWARLLPYARQLHSGQSGDATFDVQLMNGPTMSPREVRDLGIAEGRIVAFHRSNLREDDYSLAARFGAALNAPVLIAGSGEMEHVRALASDQFELHTPKLSMRDLEFLECPVAEPPPRPWLTSAVSVDDLSIDTLLYYVDDDDAATRGALRSASSVSVEVVTPAVPHASGHTVVELRSQDRTISFEPVPSDFPGHHIVANLDGFPHHRLDTPAGRGLGSATAQAIVACAHKQLTDVAARVIESGTRFDESPAAQLIALGSVVRNAFLRVRRTEDGVVLKFARHSNTSVSGPFTQRILTTISGDGLSVDDLSDVIARSGGLLYAATDTAGHVFDDLVIRANDATKHLLARLVGPLSFVDLDNEPDWARLPSAELDDKQLAAMVARLHEPQVAPAAFRHLVRRTVEGKRSSVLEHVSLFRTALGYSLTPAQVRQRLADGEMAMFDGWPHAFKALAPSPAPDSAALAMESFTFHRLSRLGRIVPVLDVDYSSTEAVQNPLTPSRAFLEFTTIDEDDVSGIIGFPMQRIETPVLVWFNRTTGATVALTQTARDLGIVGRISTTDMDERQVMSLFERRSRSLLDRAVNALGRTEPDEERRTRALEVLLDFCTPHLSLSRRPSGEVVLNCNNGDASRILGLPLLPTDRGVSVSIWRYLTEFATYGDLTSGSSRTTLASDAPKVIVEWLARTTDVPRYVPETAVELPSTATRLDQWLTGMLDALRVDGQEPFDLAVREQPEELALVGNRVFISPHSPLLREVEAASGQAKHEAAAWLLLAAYAVINEMRVAVTNDHELQFQARVLDWLDGNLAAPTPDPI